MKIGFIRHGSTSWNKEKRAQGSSDIHLDNHGRRDAARLGESLLKEEWDLIYTSDLSRAKETAEIIGRILHIDVRTDSRLREAGGGQIEGTTEQERIEKWGEKWRELDLGIEKPEDVVARAHESINELYKDHPGQNILIISHGSFLRHFFQSTLPELNHERHIVNTSLTVLRREGDNWFNEVYHSTSHLE